jgi:hypothetical protein
MGCAAMDVAARQGETRANGKLMGRARGSAQHDFGGEDVTSETGQSGDLYPDELAESVADLQMMGREVERYDFHV